LRQERSSGNHVVGGKNIIKKDNSKGGTCSRKGCHFISGGRPPLNVKGKSEEKDDIGCKGEKGDSCLYPWEVPCSLKKGGKVAKLC